MCGICGMYKRGDTKINLTDKKQVSQMLSLLQHRGPDDEGIYTDEKLLFGHRRLSIIDLEKGHQPMCNENNDICIVYNGEIYNYKELTQYLKRKGHTFRSSSDTEVIIHLYEDHNRNCVNFLDGIFAFALWDKKRETILLARDRIGVKPLYYFIDEKEIGFSSEIKSLLCLPEVNKDINLQSIHYFLSFNYLPPPFTPFKHIYSLTPAHILIASKKNVNIIEYWKPLPKQLTVTSEEKILEEFKEKIEKNIISQTVSDVPIGIFLSGGIDSSTITEILSRPLSGQPLNTFNVRFKEKSYDEGEYANLVSKRFHTNHREIYCGPQDFKNLFSKLIWHADNLTTDISMLPLFLISQLARENVKVILSGDGADELLLGYPTYIADIVRRFYIKLPVLFRKSIKKMAEGIPISSKKMSWESNIKRFLYGAELKPLSSHLAWRLIWTNEEKNLLYSKYAKDISLKDPLQYHQTLFDSLENIDSLVRYQIIDLKIWLAGSILPKVDAMSMANSLEVRVPFLAHNLVEFLISLPSHIKMRMLKGKFILKEVMQKRLPKRILSRPKAGFNIPIDNWLRKDLRNMLLDILNKENINSLGYFNYPYVENIIKEHLMLKKNHGYKLLGLMWFCIWYNLFIKNKMNVL